MDVELHGCLGNKDYVPKNSALIDNEIFWDSGLQPLLRLFSDVPIEQE